LFFSSTYPRQLFPRQHVHDPRPADGGFHDDPAGVIRDRFADDDGGLSARVGVHDFKHRRGPLLGHEGQELSFVGHVEGVESQQFADAGRGVPDGDPVLVDPDADAGGVGDFVKGAAHAAPGGVPEHMDVGADREHLPDKTVEGRGVADQIGVKGEALPLGQNGHAVIGDRAAQNDMVAGRGPARADIHAVHDPSDARGVDEDLVRGALGDDLGVPGDDGDPGGVGGVPHGLQNPFQIRQRESLFDDQADAQVERHGAAHGQIVDGAVDGQVPDVSAGKENGVHHEGVGGKGQPRSIDGEDGPVVQPGENGVVEQGRHGLGDEPVGEFAAAAVVEGDGVCFHGRFLWVPIAEKGHGVPPSAGFFKD